MKTTVLLQAEEFERVIDRLASQIIERRGICNNVVLVGIQRRGVDLARRLATALNTRIGHEVPQYALDINLYRDDWTTVTNTPVIGNSYIPSSLDNKDVLLVDDVLFTGRTIRAALEALLDYGRPRRVELVVLVDRGHRELPIHADYVGRQVHSRRTEVVNVLMRERDGKDAVELQRDDDE